MPTAICQACARVMRDKADFPRGNFSSDFCVDCVDECGRLKPRDVIRNDMIKYRTTCNGLSEEEAIEAVDHLMERLPVWRPRKQRVS